MHNSGRKLGLLAATSLVVGNMIGAGIFVLPAALAGYGGIGLLGWFFAAAGALVLARIFSNFSKIIVNKSGGPYAYSKAGFGDFIGFLVAWGYWISIWVSNGAIAIAIVSALSFFVPQLEEHRLLAVGTGLAFIWLLTWINALGVKEGGRMQVVFTALKLVPLLFVIVVGIFFFDLANFPEFNLTGGNFVATLSAAATLTLYAFLGVESASVPAENIESPEKVVPRATMLGTLLTTAVYILSTVVLFGIVPVDILKDSPAPFAEAADRIGGSFAGYLVAAGAALSGIGALNGWILITGQVPMATAKDRLFPGVFKRQNKRGSPVIGLVVGGVLSSVVMMMNYSESLVDQFEFMVLLTTLSCLIPYVFTAAAYALVVIEKKLQVNRLKAIGLAVLGFAYSIWAISGAGHDTVFYGFLLLLLGIPLYVYMKFRNKD